MHTAHQRDLSLFGPVQWWPGAKSDPFVVLNVGDSAAATSVVKQDLNPVWDETFYLFIRHGAAAACAASSRASLPPCHPCLDCWVLQ